MLKLHKTGLLLLATFIGLVATAQEAAPASTDKQGFMRSDGKIYVVVAIVLTILAGLVLYVARLDKKITNLEKKDNHK
jgi:multisubunit Na+/H+ antiporter MnhB subunit